jgi:hypothetical protein
MFAGWFDLGKVAAFEQLAQAFAKHCKKAENTEAEFAKLKEAFAKLEASVTIDNAGADAGASSSETDI